jgi:hypothetical protein
MVVQEPFDSDDIFRRVEDLVAFGPRRTGTQAAREAARYVAQQLEAAGLPEVFIDEASSSRWSVDLAALSLGPASIDCFPVSSSGIADGHLGPFGTGAAGVTAPVVDLDAADAEDLAGAIALFDVRFQPIDVDALFGGEVPADLLDGTKFGEFYRSLPDGKFSDPYNTSLPECVARAIEAGAVGFVAVLADYFESNRYVNEDYGDLSIPGVWVTRSTGARIRELIAQDEGLTGTLTLTGEVTPATGFSPVAILPGRSDETIVVHSHHDSAFDGAVQDASGTAVVLALAEHFASVPFEERPRTLMFTTMDTHFAGYESHEAFVANYVQRQRDGRRILVDISIEHIARDSRIEAGDLVVLDDPAPRLILSNLAGDAFAAVEEAAEDLPRLLVLPTSILPTDELPTDADFSYRAGVSVVSLISAPLYLYDECDTVDKVDREQLAPVAAAFADIIDRLAALPALALEER